MNTDGKKFTVYRDLIIIYKNDFHIIYMKIKMTTLADELELLKIQQEKLEKRIQDEKEQKRLEHQSTMEHLEELVKPLTEELDIKGKILDYTARQGSSLNNIQLRTKEIKISKREQLQVINNNYKRYLLEAKKIKDGIHYKRKDPNIVLPKEIRDQLDELVIIPRPPMNKKLLTEEIYVTLIGILKKQDERIKELEQWISEIKNIKSEN